jgi:hypothetical protein
MNYKDVEWWVCCAFIIIISYTLGTLTGIPAWSETDTKLSVFSSIATGIAGLATAFAAFYAYKSFQSWEERTKKQHFLENKAAAIKELSLCFQKCMADMGLYLAKTQRLEVHLKEVKGIHDTVTKEKKKEVDLSYEKIFEDIYKYKSTFSFLESFYEESIIPEYNKYGFGTHFKAVSKLAKDGDDWVNTQNEYLVKGEMEILSLYENKV